MSFNFILDSNQETSKEKDISPYHTKLVQTSDRQVTGTPAWNRREKMTTVRGFEEFNWNLSRH